MPRLSLCTVNFERGPTFFHKGNHPSGGGYFLGCIESRNGSKVNVRFYDGTYEKGLDAAEVQPCKRVGNKLILSNDDVDDSNGKVVAAYFPKYLVPGDLVLADYYGGGKKWFRGRVVHVNDNKCDIAYDDLDFQEGVEIGKSVILLSRGNADPSWLAGLEVPIERWGYKHGVVTNLFEPNQGILIEYGTEKKEKKTSYTTIVSAICGALRRRTDLRRLQWPAPTFSNDAVTLPPSSSKKAASRRKQEQVPLGVLKPMKSSKNTQPADSPGKIARNIVMVTPKEVSDSVGSSSRGRPRKNYRDSPESKKSLDSVERSSRGRLRPKKNYAEDPEERTNSVEIIECTTSKKPKRRKTTRKATSTLSCESPQHKTEFPKDPSGADSAFSHAPVVELEAKTGGERKRLQENKDDDTKLKRSCRHRVEDDKKDNYPSKVRRGLADKSISYPASEKGKQSKGVAKACILPITPVPLNLYPVRDLFVEMDESESDALLSSLNSTEGRVGQLIFNLGSIHSNRVLPAHYCKQLVQLLTFGPRDASLKSFPDHRRLERAMAVFHVLVESQGLADHVASGLNDSFVEDVIDQMSDKYYILEGDEKRITFASLQRLQLSMDARLRCVETFEILLRHQLRGCGSITDLNDAYRGRPIVKGILRVQNGAKKTLDKMARAYAAFWLEYGHLSLSSFLSNALPSVHQRGQLAALRISVVKVGKTMGRILCHLSTLYMREANESIADVAHSFDRIFRREISHFDKEGIMCDILSSSDEEIREKLVVGLATNLEAALHPDLISELANKLEVVGTFNALFHLF